MSTIYAFDVEEWDDDIKFNPTGKAYRVTIYEHGEEIGDGVAPTLANAFTEALQQSGVIE